MPILNYNMPIFSNAEHSNEIMRRSAVTEKIYRRLLHHFSFSISSFYNVHAGIEFFEKPKAVFNCFSF